VTDVRNGLFLATEPTLFACLSDLHSPAGIVWRPAAELEDVRKGLFLETNNRKLFVSLSFPELSFVDVSFILFSNNHIQFKHIQNFQKEKDYFTVAVISCCV
jgi:hypothetical protein